MSSSLSFTPLFGVSASSPFCGLLRCDDFTILLDCGWNEEFDTTMLEAVKPYLNEIDCVLISHSSLSHLGGLPGLISAFGLCAPVYVTVPVWRMGQMVLYDAIQNHGSNGSINSLLSLDHVDSTFERVKKVKYSEEIRLQSARNADSNQFLIVTPMAAGHTIGGTMWNIQLENDSIVYAVCYNHTRERHLNGAAVNLITRPTLLITDALTAHLPDNLMPRKQRDQNFTDAVQRCIERGGSILLPSDSAGRTLEILMMVNQLFESLRHSKENRLAGPAAQYSLAFLSPQSSNTVEFARSQIEWMSEACQRHFDSSRDNPFSFRFMKFISSLDQLQAMPKPHCVLFTSHSLSNILAQQIMEIYGPEEKNLILFTQKPPDESLAQRVIKAGKDRKSSGKPQIVEFDKPIRVPLEGAELSTHLAEKKLEASQAELESKQWNEEDSDDEDAEAQKRMDEAMAAAAGNEIHNSAAAVAVGINNDNLIAADSVTDSPHISGSKKRSASLAFNNHHAFNSYSGNPTPSTAVSLPSSSLSAKFYTFPWKETKRNGDVYGEDGLIQELLTIINKQNSGSSSFNSGGAVSFDGIHQPVTAAPMNDEISTILTPAPIEIPTKLLLIPSQFTIACRVEYMDFTGLSDFRSVKQILQNCIPRCVLIIQGTPEGRNNLNQYLANSKIAQEILQPTSAGDSVSVASLSNVLRVRLSEALLNAAKFIRIGDFELAHTQAIVKLSDQSAMSKSVSNFPTLTPRSLAVGESKSLDGPPSAVFLGDFKFSDLKRVLAEAGIPSEFISGCLVASNGLVNIRKVSATQIAIKGVLSEQYFKIRQLLYSRYTIV